MLLATISFNMKSISVFVFMGIILIVAIVAIIAFIRGLISEHNYNNFSLPEMIKSDDEKEKQTPQTAEEIKESSVFAIDDSLPDLDSFINNSSDYKEEVNKEDNEAIFKIDETENSKEDEDKNSHKVLKNPFEK